MEAVSTVIDSFIQQPFLEHPFAPGTVLGTGT